jgi:beta-carotene ketolase (CrtW type)
VLIPDTAFLEVEKNQTETIKKTLDRQLSSQTINPKVAIYGGLIASVIIGLWITSLSIFLSLNITQFPAWIVSIAALWQTFLYTGLFITAHDAMHGSVCPESPQLNHQIGSFCALSYGLFSYKELLQKHWLHHRYPASDQDPDFHNGRHKNPVSWYFHFMTQYWSWKRFWGLALLFILLHFGFHVPVSNLLIFWIVPSLLSSIQLFYFGTFLTHREPRSGYTTPQRTQTNPLPTFWSLVTCYHFGYHHEHHEFPYLPWWRLPRVHNMSSVQ